MMSDLEEEVTELEPEELESYIDMVEAFEEDQRND